MNNREQIVTRYYGGDEIRKYIKDNGVLLWKVAEEYGVTDGNFSRRLRKRFSPREAQEIVMIVRRIKEREALENDI